MKKAIVGAVNRPIIRIITVIAESLERKAADRSPVRTKKNLPV